MPKKELY